MAERDWDLLRGLPPEHLSLVLAEGETRKVLKGEILFRLGEEAKEIFLVVEGKVNLTLPLRVGGRPQDVFVEERLPGQLLGWSGLIPPYRYTLQAAATADTELLALPRSALFGLFTARPDIGYPVFANLARVIGQRLQVFQTMWIREVQHAVEAHHA